MKKLLLISLFLLNAITSAKIVFVNSELTANDLRADTVTSHQMFKLILEKKDIVNLERLLKQGFDPNAIYTSRGFIQRLSTKVLEGHHWGSLDISSPEAQEFDLKMLKLLVRYGANLNLPEDKFNISNMLSPAFYGDRDILFKYVLDNSNLSYKSTLLNGHENSLYVSTLSCLPKMVKFIWGELKEKTDLCKVYGENPPEEWCEKYMNPVLAELGIEDPEECIDMYY